MVSLKGTRDGLLISLGGGEWYELLADLSARFDRPGAAEFFRGAHVRLDSGGRALSDDELGQLQTLLAQHGMQLWVFEEPETPRDVPPEADAEVAPVPPAEGHELELWTEAALVRRTVRSGQIIRYPGHVVVYGDVNPGGEIVAGGDVIVWGKLRGMVHAGALGDERAAVGALLLAPTQLRIGAHIARAPDASAKTPRGAEVARVRDGRIVIEGWRVGKNGKKL